MNLKNISSKVCKINASGANVVQNFKYVKITHIHLELLSFQKLMNTCINCKLVIDSYFKFALVCVGINHRKGGD
jgi:hypothetical protein